MRIFFGGGAFFCFLVPFQAVLRHEVWKKRKKILHFLKILYVSYTEFGVQYIKKKKKYNKVLLENCVGFVFFWLVFSGWGATSLFQEFKFLKSVASSFTFGSIFI